MSNRTKERGYVFPLYLFSTDNQTTIEGNARIPNLKPEIVSAIASKIGLQFESEKSKDNANFAPIDLLDYIYGVLHTPSYRERYKEFLKVDFPRIPYSGSAEQFRSIAYIGSHLRRLHLMETIPNLITQFNIPPKDGKNTIVENIKTTSPNDEGKMQVWINDTQYFDCVPLVAWEFYIGGYQPAQKWLKDRRSRTLNFDDITHYQRIIAILLETHNLMQKL